MSELFVRSWEKSPLAATTATINSIMTRLTTSIGSAIARKKDLLFFF